MTTSMFIVSLGVLSAMAAPPAPHAGDRAHDIVELEAPTPEADAEDEAEDEAPTSLIEQMSEDEVMELVRKAAAGEQLSAEEAVLVEELAVAMHGALLAELQYQHGDVSIGDGLATLHLGDDFKFLGPADARKIIEVGWGNPPGEPAGVLGMIVPTDVNPLAVNGWGVIVTYTEDGHIDDSDAADIDYDQLLKDMQEATEAANAARTEQGYPALHLAGWAEPPHYDATNHRLYWAQELQSEDGSSLNYAIRVLGRKGVLELNAVAGMAHLQTVKPQMEQVLDRVEFQAGNRYIDFDPDIDDVAAYGIGGLIAGKLAMKAGVFAVLLKFLLAAKKFLFLGIIGIGAVLARFFKRTPKSE